MLMKWEENASIDLLALRPLERKKIWEQPGRGIQFPIKKEIIVLVLQRLQNTMFGVFLQLFSSSELFRKCYRLFYNWWCCFFCLRLCKPNNKRGHLSLSISTFFSPCFLPSNVYSTSIYMWIQKTTYWHHVHVCVCVCGMHTVCSLFVLVSSRPIGIDRTILSMEKAAYGGSLAECQGRHMDGGGRTGVGMHVNIGENVRGSA